jgi:hypothetical protein
MSYQQHVTSDKQFRIPEINYDAGSSALNLNCEEESLYRAAKQPLRSMIKTPSSRALARALPVCQAVAKKTGVVLPPARRSLATEIEGIQKVSFK